eukprot:365338-Chlamydomonas_euryale.AAC.30
MVRLPPEPVNDANTTICTQQCAHHQSIQLLAYYQEQPTVHPACGTPGWLHGAHRTSMAASGSHAGNRRWRAHACEAHAIDMT